MRVSASIHPAAQPAAKNESQHPSFLAFREKIRSTQPASVWHELRDVSRQLFGAGVFHATAGQTWKALSLDKAQLQTFADHPGKVERAIHQLQAKGVLPKDTHQWSAAKAARLYASTAKSVLAPAKKNPSTFTVATVNDDFGTRKSNLPGVKADVVLVQEAKFEKVRKLEPAAFGVHQDTSRQDKAGTAVVWNKQVVHAHDAGYAVGVKPGHDKMETRWINYTDVTVDGRKVRMISVHRPPVRFKDLWPQFDRNVAAFVKQTKKAGLPMVIGMDSNEHGGPHALARASGLVWHGPKGSIDGFLVSPALTVEKIQTLPKNTSDHHPLVATIRFK